MLFDDSRARLFGGGSITVVQAVRISVRDNDATGHIAFCDMVRIKLVVERLFELDITSGCSAGPPPLYCPNKTVSGAEMAAFIARAWRLPLPPRGAPTRRGLSLRTSGIHRPSPGPATMALACPAHPQTGRRRPAPPPA